MGSPRTDLVSTLPTESLKVALNFVKGQRVSARDMAIAAENIFSFAADQFLPDDEPLPVFASRGSMHAIQAPSQQDVEAAFARVMSAPPKAAANPKGKVAEGPQQDAPTIANPTSKVDWKTIIQTLLPFILGLL